MPKDLIKRTDVSPASLDDLAQRINLAHEGAIRSARTAIEYAIECGRLLTEAKTLVAHGQWLPWLQANTIVSERTAQRWMRFAENAEALLAKSDTDGGFTFADADRLLATYTKPASAAPKFHPITEIIPMMRDDELHALAESIRAVGQIVQIVVDEKTNMIVDGRCRWRACEIAGVEPKIERREFADDRDILDFIISMNVHRSHKTEDQCAMAAARLERQEEWLPRLHSDFETTNAEAAQRLPELQAEITAVEKIDGLENQIRAMLALRNESLEWMNKLTEIRVFVDREFGEAMPEKELIEIFGESRASDCRTFALADDEMFRDAIETVKRRDEELTDKRLQREIEWRLKQR
jgi:hypothetical protein